jgi:ABC-2 type transport system ATP-binding protein
VTVSSPLAAPDPVEPVPVIEAAGLTKVYPGDIRAVDGLDLVVHRGEIFGLLGPNGAGKSTTAGMLTTRVLPTAGTALVGGVDVVAHPAMARQLIGVVPQGNTLDRALTVRENLYFHGRFFGMGGRESRRESDRLLEQFRLTERATAAVSALSGGMAQRLMVARAVMHRPEVLFLDEPTAGLDPQSRIALWEVLGELHHDGQTILLTTHYMEEADQLCHRLGIIDHGRMLALDTPARLKASVGADTVVTISVTAPADGTAPDLEAFASSLREQIPGATHADATADGVTLGVSGTTAGVLPAVVTHAEAAGVDVSDLKVQEPTLETVFIDLTGKDLRE